MIGFPFDSHVEYDSAGTPVFDRAVNSAGYRSLLRQLFKTGVMPTPSTQLQVTAQSNMVLQVLPGFCMIEGLMKLEETARTLNLAPADASDRIDTVVMRLNDNDDVRSCELAIIKGTPAGNPSRPNLTRTDSVYEIGLADVYVKANVSTITAASITDTRMDGTRCGWISSISEIDTTTLFDQMNAKFYEWFDGLVDVLDEDTAAHLQNEIYALQTRMSSADARITAVDGKVDDINDSIMATVEECEASTTDTDIAGAQAVGELSERMGGLSFGQTEDGKWGYKVGADPVVPFNQLETIDVTFVPIGAATSGYYRQVRANIASVYPDYRNLTIDNMKIVFNGQYPAGNTTLTYINVYDPSTGNLTIQTADLYVYSLYGRNLDAQIIITK